VAAQAGALRKSTSKVRPRGVEVSKVAPGRGGGGVIYSSRFGSYLTLS